MFCPQCKAEYRSGFTKCSDCGVTLVFRLTDEEDDEEEFDSTAELVTIRTYANPVDVELARSVLLSAGIKSMIRGGDRNARGMGTSATLGFELVVRADEAEDAHEVLDAGDG